MRIEQQHGLAHHCLCQRHITVDRLDHLSGPLKHDPGDDVAFLRDAKAGAVRNLFFEREPKHHSVEGRLGVPVQQLGGGDDGRPSKRRLSHNASAC